MLWLDYSTIRFQEEEEEEGYLVMVETKLEEVCQLEEVCLMLINFWWILVHFPPMNQL